MSQHFAIGDIQGCYSGLRRLLDACQFDPNHDTLYPVGDLIARGDDSLRTLQFLMSLGKACQPVLGNHDLHFLAIASGIRMAKKSDRIDDLLAHRDCAVMIDWLRKQPLARRFKKHTLIVHAGLFPAWSIKQAQSLSDEIHALLSGEDWQTLLGNMYGPLPNQWQEDHTRYARCRFIINAMTRMRYIGADLSLDFDYKDSPESAHTGLSPWFSHTNIHLKKKQRIVFGHWASLMGQTHSEQFIGLDTGYVWGGQMTALDLESGRQIRVSNIKK